MSEVHIEFNSDGFREVLLSAGTEEAVRSAAEDIRSRAEQNSGESFTMHTWQGNYGGGRWIGSVSTADDAAARAEAENGALSGAVS